MHQMSLQNTQIDLDSAADLTMSTLNEYCSDDMWIKVYSYINKIVDIDVVPLYSTRRSTTQQDVSITLLCTKLQDQHLVTNTKTEFYFYVLNVAELARCFKYNVTHPSM